MDEPAKAASRILYGTGFGLILACGFGLIQDRMELTEIGFGHIFLGISLICLVSGRLLAQNKSYLKSYFPDEDEEEMADRIHEEMNEIENDSAVGNAWAELESQVLEEEIKSEQE
tara:strand:+ start:13997 stop:14341 length:345 start_codon:yes stop_codon:yes gene_type:complete